MSELFDLKDKVIAVTGGRWGTLRRDGETSGFGGC